eukprot:8410456-Karenia_brevis.AAC.1
MIAGSLLPRPAYTYLAMPSLDYQDSGSNLPRLAWTCLAVPRPRGHIDPSAPAIEDPRVDEANLALKELAEDDGASGLFDGEDEEDKDEVESDGDVDSKSDGDDSAPDEPPPACPPWLMPDYTGPEPGFESDSEEMKYSPDSSPATPPAGAPSTPPDGAPKPPVETSTTAADHHHGALSVVPKPVELPDPFQREVPPGCRQPKSENLPGKSPRWIFYFPKGAPHNGKLSVSCSFSRNWKDGDVAGSTSGTGMNMRSHSSNLSSIRAYNIVVDAMWEWHNNRG